MPQIYARSEPSRRRSSSSASSSSSSSTSTGLFRPIDADDSMVLSDLLRSGEASRLRRRGAMRIDHSSVTNATGVSNTGRNLVLVDRPNWDSDFDFDISSQSEAHIGRPTSIRYPRRRQRLRRYGPYNNTAAEQDETEGEILYTLVCGAEQTDGGSDDYEAFRPSILPLYPPPQPSKAKETKRSSGCGAVAHVRAAPRPRVGVWSACGPASDSVVPLDADYFDTREAAKIVRSKCGCINEGIGCALCGNPLGTRYIPCKSASESFLSVRSEEKYRPVGPEGPSYWHSSNSPSSSHSVYTFFGDSVTPSPSYEFPGTKSGTRLPLQPNNSEFSLGMSYLPDTLSSDDEGDSYPGTGEWSSDLTARGEEDTVTTSNVILGRFSASPAPLSDTEDLPQWLPPRTYSHARRPRIYPSSAGNEGSTVPFSYSPPISFYQQQVIGAWERERERERENDRRRPGGESEFDPDGESVWGVVDPDDATGATGMQEPGSPDKSNERFIFPER